MRQVLRIAIFRRLLAAYVLNELGWAVGTLALALLVYRRTGSAIGSTGFFLCSQVVPALISPALVAKLDRRAPNRLLPTLYAIEAALFDLRFSSVSVINVDDPHGAALCDRVRSRGLDVCTYSIDDPTADVYARDVSLRRDETVFDLVDARNDHHGIVRSPLLGRFNVANSLAAAATALAVGFSFEAVLAGLGAAVRVPGRFERVGAGGDFAVLVDYAHTPDALASVLGAARSLVDGGKLVVVFGCGGDRDRSKRPLMGEVAVRLADVAILTSDNARSEDPSAIARDVLDGVPPGRAAPAVELDRRAAIRAAVRSAGTGDVVVIAGKGHETGQTLDGVTTPFDDRVVAAEELEACP